MKEEKKEEQKRFCYRVAVDSPTGKAIRELMAKSEETFNAASKLAMELGASGFDTSSEAVMSGIGMLFFDKKPSERRFKVIAKNSMGYACIPNHEKEAGRKVMMRIAQLPVIPVEEAAKVFHLKWGTPKEKGRTMTMPRFFQVEKEWYYITHDEPLTLPDAEEIGEGEFEEAWEDVNN